MIERLNGDRARPRKFFTLFIVLSMKWVVVAFPATLIVGLLLATFAPSALSAGPPWAMPVIVGTIPFALGLVSACWVWRRGGALSGATEPQIDRPIWLFSAVTNRWLFLIVMPLFIIVVMVLGRFGVAIPSRVVFMIGLGVVLLLLGLRLADGVRRLRQP
jgi:hypothetical protein